MAPRKRLGDLLLEGNVLTRQGLEDGLKAQMIYGGRLGTCLVELGLITEDRLAKVLSDQLRLPIATRELLDKIPPRTLELLSPQMADRFKAIPFRIEGRRLDLAVVDPTPEAIDGVQFATGLNVNPYIAPEVYLEYLLERLYGIPRAARYIRIADADPTFQKVQMQGLSGEALDSHQSTSARASAPRPAPSAGSNGHGAAAPTALDASGAVVRGGPPMQPQASPPMSSPSPQPFRPPAGAQAGPPLQPAYVPPTSIAPPPFAAATSATPRIAPPPKAATALPPPPKPRPASPTDAPDGFSVHSGRDSASGLWNAAAVGLRHVVHRFMNAQEEQDLVDAVVDFAEMYFERVAVFVAIELSYVPVRVLAPEPWQERLLTVRLPVGQGVLNAVLTTGKAYNGPLPTAQHALTDALVDDALSPVFVVPIFTGKNQGVLVCAHPRRALADVELRQFSLLAERASVALELLLLRRNLAVLPEDMS